MNRDVVLITADATLRRYVRTFDRLELELQLWDETTCSIQAFGVTFSEDEGTWEADALVRVPELDRAGGRGYGVIDTEGNLTLRFVAERVEV